MNNRNYWCYRIDTRFIPYFKKELDKGNLRQGWGWDPGQNLNDFTVNEGASGNFAIRNKVKKGDILLVPRLPDWGQVAIVEATDDWDKAYRFEIDKEKEDYGHIFPAKFIKSFSRTSNAVSGGVRATLKNVSRFWNINRYAEDVEKLLGTENADLLTKQDHESRYKDVVESVFANVFDKKAFSEQLYKGLIEKFSNEEWEFALIYGLKKLFPFYQVERVGGPREKIHGTDILITLPSLTSTYQYAIAVQVKDYSGEVGEAVIEQINKASAWDTENLKVIDKIVLVIKSHKDDNQALEKNDSGVKSIFANELQDLIAEIGKSLLGIKKTSSV